MAIESIMQSSKLLAEKGLKIAFAESATAGWLASEFALVPNSGKVLLGGIICYDVCTKEHLFAVSKEIIETFTPESAEVTQLLAEGLDKYFKSDVAVAVTGLTAPGGSESKEKPVGTMFIHILCKDSNYCSHREVFEGSQKEIINKTIERVGDLLCRILEKIE